jgi:hypothetical protein
LVTLFALRLLRHSLEKGLGGFFRCGKGGSEGVGEPRENLWRREGHEGEFELREVP